MHIKDKLRAAFHHDKQHDKTPENVDKSGNLKNTGHSNPRKSPNNQGATHPSASQDRYPHDHKATQQPSDRLNLQHKADPEAGQQKPYKSIFGGTEAAKAKSKTGDPTSGEVPRLLVDDDDLYDFTPSDCAREAG